MDDKVRSGLETGSISDREFLKYQELLHRIAGISLPITKKALLCGRLAKRLRHHGLDDYGAYYELIAGGRQPAELQAAIDLLTTNETHFFREPKHFDVLRNRILPTLKPGRTCRIWSAASSTGEEAYTIAMVLAEALGEAGPWEVLGSDISTRVLEQARAGLYSMERAHEIPAAYLSRYCLRGVDDQEGTLLVDRRLRARVSFQQINLNASLPNVGEFDVIFLRNVMIYFDMAMKRQVVSRLAQKLKPGGWFIIGHSESLNGVTDALPQEMPTVYRKPAG
jgi:chemotaxis protein methyltransferase CheR